MNAETEMSRADGLGADPPEHLSTAQSLYCDGPGDDNGGPQHNRFVVMLAAAYGPADTVETAEEAAEACLELTRDGGHAGTHWYVLDRESGEVRDFEQSEFDSRQAE